MWERTIWLHSIPFEFILNPILLEKFALFYRIQYHIRQETHGLSGFPLSIISKKIKNACKTLCYKRLRKITDGAGRAEKLH